MYLTDIESGLKKLKMARNETKAGVLHAVGGFHPEHKFNKNRRNWKALKLGLIVKLAWRATLLTCST